MEFPFSVTVNWFRSRWSCDITSLKFGFSCQWSRIFKVFLSVISLYLALDYFGYHEKTHLIIVYYSAWNCAGIVFLTKFQLLLRANVSFKGTNFENNGGMLPKIQMKNSWNVWQSWVKKQCYILSRKEKKTKISASWQREAFRYHILHYDYLNLAT